MFENVPAALRRAGAALSRALACIRLVGTTTTTATTTTSGCGAIGAVVLPIIHVTLLSVRLLLLELLLPAELVHDCVGAITNLCPFDVDHRNAVVKHTKYLSLSVRSVSILYTAVLSLS